MDVFTLHRGSTPLLISIPHAGTFVLEEIGARFTAVARRLPDTDWCVCELYNFARGLGASVIAANYSRYVVDLNRAADSAALYRTHRTTPVCSTETFAGEPIYLPGAAPGDAEIEERVQRYWRPYHDALAAELQRLRAQHGYALLWDAHSIVSELPALFAGVLPEFNFGTRDDASCPRDLAERLLDLVTSDGQFGGVLNGRFRGGYITAHYGQPLERTYAVQLELAQRTYMDETAPGAWDPQRAIGVQRLVGRLLQRFLELGAASGTRPA